MPRVVFGATVLGNLFVAMSDDEKRRLIGEWFKVMPRPVAIDSAGKYGAGLSLEVIARELKALKIDPADVIISNKLAWRRVPLIAPEPTFEPGVWIDIDHDAVQDISYEGILRCHEDGCRMLDPYRPQLVTVHDPDEYLAAATGPDDRSRRLKDLLGAHRALQELRDAGQVAGVGVGAKDWRVIRELAGYCEFDWIMMANSFTIMNHPPELVEFIQWLADQEIALVNSAVTHGGFLVGGEFLDYRPIDEQDPADAQRIQWRDRFHAVCQRYGTTPYRAAIAFAVSHPGVTSLALSTSRPARVVSMVQAVDDPLPEGMWETLCQEGLVNREYPYLS